MVAVVTDSAANIPAGTQRDLGIQVVPMYLNLGDRVYRDGEDLSPSDFYRRLVSDAEVATTSTPSPGDYLEAFERSGQDQIVCVTVASSMSSSHQQAASAAGRFEGRVEVVDSRTAAMAQGFAVMEAAKAAAGGAAIDVVARRAREVSAQACLYATVDTFEFLRRSGRVTKLQAYAATMLDIKPVFGFRDGEIVPIARSRTKRRALARIEEDTVRDAGDRELHLAALHAAAEQEATDLADRIGRRTNIVERIVVEVTPVIGAHTGPGLVGVAFYCDG